MSLIVVGSSILSAIVAVIADVAVVIAAATVGAGLALAFVCALVAPLELNTLINLFVCAADALCKFENKITWQI